MKRLLMPLALVLSAPSAFAMPCDTGYVCTSKHYRIEIQTCRYENRVNLVSIALDGAPVDGATLGPAYDGTYVHGPLDFEIELPRTGMQELHNLSVELPRRFPYGFATERATDIEPGPSGIVRREVIRCARSG